MNGVSYRLRIFLWYGKSLETWFGATHKPSLLGVSITCHRCRIDGFEAPELNALGLRTHEFKNSKAEVDHLVASVSTEEHERSVQ